ncbi:MAG: hypothetical protein NTX15_02745 [Candidatus Kapabacteria bacterium]|nr:hypothetical protein [Candidatus Kapabacteria bacterium]
MRVTVYLHPQRTVVAHWQVDTAVPTLFAYFERDPNETIDDLLVGADDVTVAVHGSAVTYHTFPIDATEETRERRSFELSTCLPNVREGVDVVHDVSMSATLHHTQWHGLLVIDRTVIETIHQRVHTEAHFVTDIELDMAIACATVPKQATPWMLVGRRGDQWYKAVFGADHTLQVLISSPHDADMSAGATVCQSLLDMRLGTGGFIDSVLLFGDFLTKQTYAEIAQALAKLEVRTGRLQPFRRVHSAITDATRAALAAKAHLLGPLVTPVVTSVTSELI